MASSTGDPGQQVIIVGAGTMGTSIAQAFLQNGCAVDLVDPSDIQRKRASHQLAPKTRNPADAGNRLRLLPDPSDCQTEGFVIETVAEDAQLKVKVLTDLERTLRPRLLCSNTSSLSIAELQAPLETPEHFLGMHFFQPVPETRIIEIVTAPGTSGESIRRAVQRVEGLGRRAIIVRDSPGFATSRLGVAIGLEAMRMVEEGIATPEDIDEGMVLGYQHGVGPLRMTDMVGLDVRLAISENLCERLGPRFQPPRILRDMVARGQIGRKSGEGFFTWPPVRGDIGSESTAPPGLEPPA